jgi:hypothetical protein
MHVVSSIIVKYLLNNSLNQAVVKCSVLQPQGKVSTSQRPPQIRPSKLSRIFPQRRAYTTSQSLISHYKIVSYQYQLKYLYIP